MDCRASGRGGRTRTVTVAPLHALALAAPDVLDALSPAELALLASLPELALRPDQRIPCGDWRSYGFICGRGFGKSLGIAIEINGRVASGETRAPALIAPTLDRVGEIQVPVIVETSPAWCRAEAYAGGVRWANGVTARPATSEIERPSSGDNFDLVWMTELQRWNPTTRIAAWHDITTACRVGPRAQYVWDTTSRGKNDLIAALLAQHDADLDAHRIVRGTTYDNPALARRYVTDEVRKYAHGSRAYLEEIEGKIFTSASGAIWEDSAWIENHRVSAWPSSPSVVVLGLDPALSGESWADEVGLCKGALDNGHVYLTDLSGRMSPETYARTVVRECQRGASGVVVERNHVGQHARDLIKVHAELAQMRIEILPDAARAFPPRRPGTIYIREIVSQTSKETRAAPAAALYVPGLVHHVGQLPQLEHQMLTWSQGMRSPNRLDAAVFVVSELGGVRVEHRDAARDVDAAATISAALRGRGAGRIGL